RVKARAAERPRSSSRVKRGAASAAMKSPSPIGPMTGASQLTRNKPIPTTTAVTSVAKRFVLPRTQRGTSCPFGSGPLTASDRSRRGGGVRAELGGRGEQRLPAADDLQQDPGERDRQEPDVQPEEEDAGRDRGLVAR